MPGNPQTVPFPNRTWPWREEDDSDAFAMEERERRRSASAGPAGPAADDRSVAAAKAALQAERSRFEEWYAAHAMPCEADWFRRDSVGTYTHTGTDLAWQGWAARAGATDDE